MNGAEPRTVMAHIANLCRQNRFGEALAEVETLLAREPDNPAFRLLEANVCTGLGDTDRATTAYRAALKTYGGEPRVWTGFGHALKTAGDPAGAVKAYRQAIALQPGLGEAWWSLANLKTVRFTPDDLRAMQTAAASAGQNSKDRINLGFALGKAFEDAGDYEASFAHYKQANALKRAALDYRADDVSAHKNNLARVLTEEFFAARQNGGSPAGDPIFIVGLPRSGSTLVEQILASHSAVEGTMELPDIFAMVGRLCEGAGKPFYPDILGALPAGERHGLGEEYLRRVRIHRRLGRPRFIDKMPNNFLQLGFIHLILPNAKIIDVRRRPMACGFSCYKQNFAAGQEFTYSLADIGRYYADYAELMEHYDRVLPGRVHHVAYEDLVRDPLSSIRSLLDYCGLPFEERCLRFHENTRAVRTASAEQVRRPIFTDSLEHWRHYERWLGPLKDALGSQYVA